MKEEFQFEHPSIGRGLAAVHEVLPYDDLHDSLQKLSGRINPWTGIFDRSLASTVLAGSDSIGLVIDHLTGWLPNYLDIQDQPLDITPLQVSTELEVDGFSIEISNEWGKKPEERDFLPGLVVETAGPTLGSYAMARRFGRSPDIVTNVFDRALDHDGTNECVVQPDIVADARDLPFADGSVSSVFTSCLMGAQRLRAEDELTWSLRDDAITEANRVLSPGGSLVWLGGTTEDIDQMTRLGMQPKYMKTSTAFKMSYDGYYASIPQFDVECVFVKEV